MTIKSPSPPHLITVNPDLLSSLAPFTIIRIKDIDLLAVPIFKRSLAQYSILATSHCYWFVV